MRRLALFPITLAISASFSSSASSAPAPARVPISHPQSAQTPGVDLVNVPAGEIPAIWLAPVSKKGAVKGSELPPPRVRVDGFMAMTKPVSWQSFQEFLREHPEWQKAQVAPTFADPNYLNAESSVPGAPVTNVSWFAARAYCKSLGMRLPTTDQWEYMAAASETARDANKDAKFLERILQWYGEPYGGQIRSGGSIYRNVYGIWDLHGLIWEWVDDFNSSFVSGESREDADFNKDLFCGAGALSSADKENYAAYMRFAFRSSLKGSSVVWNLGFRCVKEP